VLEISRGVRFSHTGISIAESETIYNILNKTFHVEEDEEFLKNQNVTGGVKIDFPLPFCEQFFELFTEGWFNMKHVLKDMKRRRGKRALTVQFYFDGLIQNEKILHFDLVFQLINKDQKEFEMAIEKIEYLVDTIVLELSEIMNETSLLIYTYDPLRRKWIKGSDHDDVSKKETNRRM
jgi:hypothetical protein